MENKEITMLGDEELDNVFGGAGNENDTAICSYCGKTFPYKTNREKTDFKDHMKRCDRKNNKNGSPRIQRPFL